MGVKLGYSWESSQDDNSHGNTNITINNKTTGNHELGIGNTENRQSKSVLALLRTCSVRIFYPDSHPSAGVFYRL